MSSRRGAYMSRRSGTRTGAPFNGNFATLFPAAFQVFQSDRGLTYGATPLATAGNTSTTVLTLSGAITGPYVPVLVKATNSATIPAATFSISFDNGSTFSMTGVTPTAGVGIPLTGAGAGLTLTWAAGTGVTNDTWNATSSAAADQTANGNNYSQATAAKQPTLGALLNGKPGLQFLQARATFMSSALNLAAPATTNVSLYTVFTASPFAGQQIFMGSNNAITLLSGTGALNNLIQFCSSSGPTSTALTGVPTRVRATFTGSVNDLLKVGPAADITGANSGNTVSTGFALAAGSNGGVFPGNVTIYLMVLCPTMSAAQLAMVDAAINSAAGYGVGAVVA
jgi:hypothetical protein